MGNPEPSPKGFLSRTIRNTDAVQRVDVGR
jgi:hypothetical protein